MQNLLEPITPALKPAIQSIIANLPNALIAPRTYEHNVKLDLELALSDGLSNVDPDTLVRMLRDVFATGILHFPDLFLHQCQLFTDAFLQQFSGNQEFQSLENLVTDVESRNQHECNAILKPGDQDELNRDRLTSSSLLHHALHSEGELRAEYSMHCIKRISEKLYQPYVRRIHKLVRVLNGPPAGPVRKKKQKDPPDLEGMPYGTVLNELVAAAFHTKYPGLLDPDAAFIRNAEAHESWDYHPKSDEIELHDKNRPPKLFTVLKILEKAQAIYAVSGILFHKYVAYRQFKYWLDNASKIRESWHKQLSKSLTTVVVADVPK